MVFTELLWRTKPIKEHLDYCHCERGLVECRSRIVKWREWNNYTWRITVSCADGIKMDPSNNNDDK